jgi:hypothetical protein
MEQAFLQQRPYLSVKPKEGMALAFLHSIWHEGAVVHSGQKYVLRTDVMYKPVSNLAGKWGNGDILCFQIDLVYRCGRLSGGRRGRRWTATRREMVSLFPP